MGIVKQQMLDDEANEELTSFLTELDEREELQGALSGIAKQAIAKGVPSLSEKQRDVVDKFVDHYKENRTCEMCSNGNVSGLMDYIEIEDTGICSMCQYDKDKYMNEE